MLTYTVLADIYQPGAVAAQTDTSTSNVSAPIIEIIGSGLSGWSGFSGYSGLSGASGFSGYSGYSGINGTIGSIGATGASGFSGYSGLGGSAGATGASGFSGYSGFNGANGLTLQYVFYDGFISPQDFVLLADNIPTFSTNFGGAITGKMGISFTDINSADHTAFLEAFSGFITITDPANPAHWVVYQVTPGAVVSGGLYFPATWLAGTIANLNPSSYTYNVSFSLAGASGYSGFSGSNGSTGATGTSGFSGYSGTNGATGTSGFSGANGSTGATGTSGFSGYSGLGGSSGFSGFSGKSGWSGISGSFGGLTLQYTFTPSALIGQFGPGEFIMYTNTGLGTQTNNPSTAGAVALEVLDNHSNNNTPLISTFSGILTLYDPANNLNFSSWQLSNPTIIGGSPSYVSYSFAATFLAGNITTLNLTTYTYDFSFSPQGSSGFSGANGSNGATGTSGFSGYSGFSGKSGFSGTNGTNGSNGATGISGFSGYSGAIGTSGYSGYSGKSGYSGTPAGSTTQIQYNNLGSFGASSNFTYASSQLTVSVTASGAENPNQSSTTVGSYSYSATDFNVGYQFTPSVNGYVTQLWMLMGDTLSHSVFLYDHTGTQIATGTGTAINATWVSVNITPVAVTSGLNYVVSARSGGAGARGVLAFTYPHTFSDITINEELYSAATNACPATSDTTNISGCDITFQRNLGGGTALQTSLDATSTSFQSVILSSTTTPLSPTSGQIYFDGTHFQGWNGSAWKQLDN